MRLDVRPRQPEPCSQFPHHPLTALCGTAGRAFCAGADLGGLDTLAKAKGSSQKQGVLNTQEKRTPLFPKTLNTPVICAINGACAGIGLSFALSCDIRFADSKARATNTRTRTHARTDTHADTRAFS